MGYSLNIREEELKNKVASSFFAAYDSSKILGNLDFCIADKNKSQVSYLWAEAKKGNIHNIYDSFVQLILTIGRERLFESSLPPPFLGAFDAEKIAFLPYHAIMEVFDASDFNWNVAPSNHSSNEFKKIKDLILASLENGLLLFNFDADHEQLTRFIKDNFKAGADAVNRIEITKNNFTAIYYRWLMAVKDSIGINWDVAKKKGIMAADFYLADILSADNITLKDKLFVVLKKNHYEFDRSIDELMGTFQTRTATFNDGQQAHKQFWNLYKRPPKEEFWDFIVERRDLLVPQDIRERKGSYFTPQKWVELSQKYLAQELGEDWQQEYYIWDCAAGTGNMLTGLVDKYRIWASTIDQSDVDIMKERIGNGANLLESHVFRFDFLNDSFAQLPESLQKIIRDKEKIKKLLVYINPPYAEASNIKQIAGKGKNKAAVAQTKIYDLSQEVIGNASRELYGQFLYRIFTELHGCKIGNFSTLKVLQSSYFKRFRQYFTAKLQNLFLMPADTFDNVKGQFPIGFFIWDTATSAKFEKIIADVYNAAGDLITRKTVNSYDGKKLVIDWLQNHYDFLNKPIGFLRYAGTDIQNRDRIFITSDPSENDIKKKLCKAITSENVIPMVIYFAVRQAIAPTWLNDRDHFLYPQNSWKTDALFQTDCLVYALFHNTVRAKNGVNYWIPYTEQEVDAREAFGSRFMADFLQNKTEKATVKDGLLAKENILLEFGDESLALLDAGKELYKYYHAQAPANVNASIYEIKEFFQGRNNKGKMNNKSTNAEYERLMEQIRKADKTVLTRIRAKVYEHGFLLS